MFKIIFESENLYFREITHSDFDSLAKILKDEEIMYAWEHGFSDDEVENWIDKNIMRYGRDGFSYYIAIEKKSENIVGMIGPLIEEIEDKKLVGVAWILDKEHWGKGYAVEGGRVAIKQAFDTTDTESVIAQIRPNNIASIRTAEKLGMTSVDSYIKIYNGKEMEHIIYEIKRENF